MKNITKVIAILMVVATMITLTVVLDVSTTNGEALETLVLKSGSRGEQVKTLQTKLKNQGYYTYTVDGIYGYRTVAAVKSYQKANGLTVDGIAGAKTLSSMGISSSSSSSNGYSSSDVYLLARVVYAEARGEPYTGKVAVAAVVLNRVKNSNFPNTIAGVIYQPLAFCTVADGQINLTPDEEAQRAAKDAINGWDPTNGCIYFYNPANTTNKWIWSRPINMKIGKHNFAL